MEERGRPRVPGVICLSLVKMLKATVTEKTGLSPETRYERVIHDLFKKEALQSLAKVLERVCCSERKECIRWRCLGEVREIGVFR